MGPKRHSEKRSVVTTISSSWSASPGCIAIVLSQHAILLNALYVAAATLYELAIEAVTTNDVPSVVMFLVAVRMP